MPIEAGNRTVTWDKMERLVLDLEELQRQKGLDLARRLRPGLTLEDVSNPHDFPELSDPDWQACRWHPRRNPECPRRDTGTGARRGGPGRRRDAVSSRKKAKKTGGPFDALPTLKEEMQKKEEAAPSRKPGPPRAVIDWRYPWLNAALDARAHLCRSCARLRRYHGRWCRKSRPSAGHR
jgi:hypothetical protein